MTAPAHRDVSRYGWIPDLPDRRDLLFRASRPELGQLPSRINLRAACPKVYDQGRIGSCTANAIAAGFEFCLAKAGRPVFTPSRLFIYYNERAMEGHIPLDSGAQIRDGIKSVAKVGACDEPTWPYDDAPADPETFLFPAGSHACERPSPAAYEEALGHRALEYRRLPRDLDQYRACLAGGRPFVFGFSVYEGFESGEVARTGVLNTPERGERMIGGHAVLAVGYDDATQRFLVRNSWGDGWGDGGYFTMPYAYLCDRGLASDFWTLSTVS